MSEAQKLMAEVVLRHSWNYVTGSQVDGCCECGHDTAQDNPYYSYDRGCHAQHVAAEIDKALGGLTREPGSVYPEMRWVSSGTVTE